MISHHTNYRGKNHKYFLDLVNTFSETVSPRFYTLPGTAGLWPWYSSWDSASRTIPPNTDYPLNFPLKQPHQAHTVLHWEGEKPTEQ